MSAPLGMTVIDALLDHLQQTHDFITALSDEQYQLPVAQIGQSSLGAHVRHQLDHIAALLNGWSVGALNYDDRQRGTPIESDRRLATTTLDGLMRRLHERRHQDLTIPVHVLTLVQAGREPVSIPSTLVREAVFILQHSIHHQAMMGVLARLMGVSVPDEFGMAPSTIHHRRAN